MNISNTLKNGNEDLSAMEILVALSLHGQGEGTAQILRKHPQQKVCSAMLVTVDVGQGWRETADSALLEVRA